MDRIRNKEYIFLCHLSFLPLVSFTKKVKRNKVSLAGCEINNLALKSYQTNDPKLTKQREFKAESIYADCNSSYENFSAKHFLVHKLFDRILSTR